MIKIRRLSSVDDHFQAELDQLLSFEVSVDSEIERTVTQILHQIRTHGDRALLELTRQFDNPDIDRIEEIELPRDEWQSALMS